MNKREFIKVTGVVAAGSLLLPYFSCNDPSGSDTKGTTEEGKKVSEMAFELPKLEFDFDALEPNIDARTMEIHHGKHHAGYVRKFNAALENSPMKGKELTEILGGLSDDDVGLRNNGGGHYNHTLFWNVMSPSGGGQPSGDLADAINAAFDSFDKFKAIFSNAAKTRFGSGWAWLSVDEENKLFVSSTPNQDNPLMSNLVEENGTPILGLDVWEHAYYLNYQNRRGDYVANFFNVIDWNKVAGNLNAAG